MKYAGMIKNDFAAAPGTCVTFFTQGCPHRCKGCHNPETWDFNGGKEVRPEIFEEIRNALFANGIKRKFCIMGGEPLCEENFGLVKALVYFVKCECEIKEIFIWTGYIFDELPTNVKEYLEKENITVIDGPYIEELRDISLFMKGSSNQCILDFGNNL